MRVANRMAEGPVRPDWPSPWQVFVIAVPIGILMWVGISWLALLAWRLIW